MNKYQIKKTLGFSLIEVLIALVILAVGLLGLAKIQGITLLNSAESRMQTHALNFAQEKIEELRTYGNTSTYTAYASNAVGTDIVGANSTFTRTWSISACPNTVECKNISVTVAWTGINGSAYNIQLTSQIAELEPARSGMVVAAVAMVGDTAAESAAKAAAHAAAAAGYEAQVAASSDANIAQKLAAAAAKAVAEQAASDAQAAADTGDASEAAAQAEIAAAAAQEILDILNTLPGTSYSFSGAVSATATAVTVEDGTCTFSLGLYFCTVSTHESEVTVTATKATNSTSCVVDLTAFIPAGCTLTFPTNCTTDWGETVADGAYITAFESASSTSCPSEQRLCSSGTLSGTYTNQSCTLVCTVPNYVTGGKINASSGPTSWNTTGPGPITYGYSGNKTVASQSQTAGANVSCTSTLLLDD
tara:strand:+ start:36230 stop:37489 length:1260 start_codon:yes stop_codon:yes gene_type:complete